MSSNQRLSVHDQRFPDQSDLRAEYDRAGFAFLRGAVDPAAAAAMADAVWAELARRHGIDRADPLTWKPTEPRGLSGLRASGVFEAIGSGPVRHAVESLVGALDGGIVDWGGALVTLPTPGQWTVPARGWHLDHPVRGSNDIELRLKWLNFIERAEPGGGGTLVVSGFQQLVSRWLAATDPAEPGPSATVRDAIFATDRWFRILRDRRAAAAADPVRERRLLEDGTVIDGTEIRVVELTGEPGDMVLLHPHLLHAASPNRSRSARVMTGGGFFAI